jgi:hypothetical protein
MNTRKNNSLRKMKQEELVSNAAEQYRLRRNMIRQIRSLKQRQKNERRRLRTCSTQCDA